MMGKRTNWARGMLGLTALGLTVVSGCYEINPGDKRNETNYSSKSAESAADDGPRAYGSELNGLLMHRNTKLAYDEKLSAAVSDVPGVAQGYVLVTDSNAYVALMTDHTATGTSGGQASRYETNNTGTQDGFYDNRTGSNTVPDPDWIASGTNSWGTVRDHEDLSHPFKQTVALKVRELKPDVKDVFISANRDFINQVNKLSQEQWMGRSLDPFVQQFNAMCDQVFSYPNGYRHAID
ncbi:YhcN/YlaJ family sporulation lipoprotein [Gorillibacterium sp. sgz5001074]|uniref:YhcN/YlaJ family sporulation lipoprotein n=1 Tax=Gorillibacterium sp. sgz5001074 TaxID=3446695 RepID=UPI003F6753B5